MTISERLEAIQAERAPAEAALKRIQNWLNTPPYVTDDQSMVISVNVEHEDAQTFIRDMLGTAEQSFDTADYPHLSLVHAQSILADLQTIWTAPYMRDHLSRMAMELSLCPIHFWDWAICFDDELPECEQIRAIFPHSHDT